MTESDDLLSRQIVARTLRTLRERRGWSWADEARSLKEAARTLKIEAVDRTTTASLVRTIARWESESKPVMPRERFQLLLGYIFAKGGDEVSMGRGSDFDDLMSAFSEFGIPDERIAELRGQVARIATPGQSLLAFLSPNLTRSLLRALAAPDSLSESVLIELDGLVADINSQIGTLPFTRLQIALTPAIEASRQLLAANPSESLSVRLARTAANAFMVAARIAFEVRDDEASTRLYTEAVSAAGRLPYWERAAIHTSHALTTLYTTQNPVAARVIVDHAVRDARRGDSRTMRARAHALQAEMAARAGQERHALNALHLAWRDMDEPDGADPALGRFGASYLQGFEGVCNLYLERGGEAEQQLARSAADLASPRQAVQRAIVTADLAYARLKSGSPEAAVELLHNCVNMVAATRARVPALRIAQVRRKLRSWRFEPFVADLDEHIADLLLSN